MTTITIKCDGFKQGATTELIDGTTVINLICGKMREINIVDVETNVEKTLVWPTNGHSHDEETCKWKQVDEAIRNPHFETVEQAMWMSVDELKNYPKCETCGKKIEVTK